MSLERALAQLKTAVTKLAQDPPAADAPAETPADVPDAPADTPADAPEMPAGLDLGGLGGGGGGLGDLGEAEPAVEEKTMAAPKAEDNLASVDNFIHQFTNDIFKQMKSWFKELFKSSFARQFGELLGNAAAKLPLAIGNDAIVSSSKKVARFLNHAAEVGLEAAIDDSSINTLCDVTEMLLKHAAEEKKPLKFTIKKPTQEVTPRKKVPFQKKTLTPEELRAQYAREQVDQTYAITSRLSPGGPDNAILRQLSQKGGLKLQQLLNLLQEAGYSLGEFEQFRPELQTKILRQKGKEKEFPAIKKDSPFYQAIERTVNRLLAEASTKALEQGKEVDFERLKVLTNYVEQNELLVDLLEAYVHEIKNDYVTAEWQKIETIWHDLIRSRTQPQALTTALQKMKALLIHTPQFTKVLEAKKPLAQLYQAYQQLNFSEAPQKVFNDLLMTWQRWLGSLTKYMLRYLVEQTAEVKVERSFESIVKKIEEARVTLEDPTIQERLKTEQSWGTKNFLLGRLRDAFQQLKVYYQETKNTEALARLQEKLNPTININQFFEKVQQQFATLTHNKHLNLLYQIRYLLILWDQLVALKEKSDGVITAPEDYIKAEHLVDETTETAIDDAEFNPEDLLDF